MSKAEVLPTTGICNWLPLGIVYEGFKKMKLSYVFMLKIKKSQKFPHAPFTILSESALSANRRLDIIFVLKHAKC